MTDLASVALVAALTTMQPGAVGPAPRQHATPFAAVLQHPPALARSARVSQAAPKSRDSLKNGAIIGLIVGSVAGLFAGAEGCVIGSGFSGDADESCTGPVLAGALIFGAAGAGIGAGIDALFDQRSIRVRFRF